MKTLWLPLLLSSVILAEEDYFRISLDATWNETGLHQQNITWDEARKHCQDCFKELTTITSRNVHLIVQNLSSDYWIGLRKSFNGTIPWSRWSNGDPVTYQNWYPGHPLPNTVKKMIPICSSTTQIPLSTPATSTQTSTLTSTLTVNSPNNFSISETNKSEDMCPILINILECLNMTYDDLERTVLTYEKQQTPNTTTYSTTPHATTFSTNFSSITNATTTESTTTSNCIFEPEPDPEVYIEDSCVVLLSFGMWKEKNCNESLPYICYDDRFFGQINISNVTTSAGNLSWSEAPGNITHYRVNITWNGTENTSNETDLYKQLENLRPGNLYEVQVFPVKCGRDLNPQNISFYSIPAGVENLRVVNVTNDSISLNWSKPEGDYQFYRISVTNISDNSCKNCTVEECTVKGLTPGNEYEFIVTAVVNETTEGVQSSIYNYTKPSCVVNLTSADNDSTVITASWKKPFGYHSGYRYCLYEDDDCTTCNGSNTTNCNITTYETIQERNKLDGARYCLCVAALTNNNSLSGEMVGITAYTRPKTVSLSLDSDNQTMTARWTIEGNYEKFVVTINTTSFSVNNNEPYTFTNTTIDLFYTFKNLKAGVLYNVSVVTLNGNLTSEPVTQSAYTHPTNPEWATATTYNTHTIILRWGAPAGSEGALINYNVKCHTAFWSKSSESNTTDRNITIQNLRPGTRYDFEVRVVAGNLTSLPVNASTQTVPEKRTLILTMLCSSEKPHQCEDNGTQIELFDKLNKTFTDNLHDLVHWKLKWVERNVLNP